MSKNTERPDLTVTRTLKKECDHYWPLTGAEAVWVDGATNQNIATRRATRSQSIFFLWRKLLQTQKKKKKQSERKKGGGK